MTGILFLHCNIELVHIATLKYISFSFPNYISNLLEVTVFFTTFPVQPSLYGSLHKKKRI